MGVFEKNCHEAMNGDRDCEIMTDGCIYAGVVGLATQLDILIW